MDRSEGGNRPKRPIKGESLEQFNFERWGERLTVDQVMEQGGDQLPVVFQFKPVEFIVVEDKFKDDWKKLFERHVDQSTIDSRYSWSGDPKETISGSPGGWDDCDYW